MGKCTKCKGRITYNNYIIRYGKPYHLSCWKHILQQRKPRKLAFPTPKAKKQLKQMGITWDLDELIDQLKEQGEQ